MKSAVLFVVFILGVHSASIPDYLHICRRNDPEVSRCIMNSVEQLRPKLKSGIPELGVPGLEPLRISDVAINRGYGNVGFKLDLQNVDVYGASDFRLTKLKLDVPNYTYKINIEFPVMRFVGDFDVDAKLLSFPIKGTGKFEANGTKCDATAILQGDLLNVDGKNFMHFASLDIKLNIGDYSLRVDNLFQGDQALNEGVNEILNQNRADLLNLATPYIQTKAAEVLLDIANKVTNNFEYDAVFPA